MKRFHLLLSFSSKLNLLLFPSSVVLFYHFFFLSKIFGLIFLFPRFIVGLYTKNLYSLKDICGTTLIYVFKMLNNEVEEHKEMRFPFFHFPHSPKSFLFFPPFCALLLLLISRFFGFVNFLALFFLFELVHHSGNVFFFRPNFSFSRIFNRLVSRKLNVRFE